jgi:hypothetical protein
MDGGNHLSGLLNGIAWATAFLHYHPNGSPLSQGDINAANKTGMSYIAFDAHKKAYCYDPKN